MTSHILRTAPAEHATSLFYDGSPGRDLVIKAGVQIRIPQKRCEEIINLTEEVCSESLPVFRKLQ